MAKLKGFREIRGFFDIFAWSPPGRYEISYEECLLVNELRGDARLMKRGLASTEYGERVQKRLEDVCDSKETIQELLSLADESW